MKRYFSLTLILTLLLISLTACGGNADSNINPNSSSGNSQTDTASGSSDNNMLPPGQTAPSTGDSSSGNGASDSTDTNSESTLPEVDFSATPSDMFTKRDKRTEYDDTAVRILLNGSSATATSDKVQISGCSVTITEEDTYVLSGTLDNGTVVVNAADSAKIHLIFDTVNITSSDSAALLILSANKVTITLVSNKNSLSNTGYFAPVDSLNVNAALYSKEDLSINGNGALTISSPAGHGISCKDDLVLAGGTYTITAANHGLDANDSIRLTASTVNIEAGKDGIHAENTDDATLGFVYIADGTYKISANDDGISAGAYLQIEDGTFDLTTTSSSSSADASGKGLKSTNSMQISAGSFTINSFDDCIHSNADITINGGTYKLTAKDDGIHADAALTVNDGDINITESYEGLEALDLTIHGGNIRLIASDDGLNAAGGNDGSGFGGRGKDNFGGRGGVSSSDDRTNKRGQSPKDKDNINIPNMPEGGFGGGNFGGFGGNFNIEDLPDSFDGNFGGFGGGNFGGGGFPGMGSSDGSVTISGGTLYIQASGDGIDANGTLTIIGGDITICGPNRGDTASLDYDLTGTISGATFIATGANGMAQTLSSPEQGVITVNVGNQNAGTTITLTDSNGKALLTQTPALAYTLVILSSPDLVSGETYTLTYGTTTKTITAD